MTDQHDVLALVQMANPIPDLEDLDPVEIQAETAAIESVLRLERTPSLRQARAPKPQYRPAMIAVAVAAAIALVIGIPVWLARSSDEPPVVNEPAPTTVTSMASTTAPTTTVAQETTAPPPATTVTTVAALPAIPNVTLARAADIPEFEGASLYRVVAGGPGLIAAGYTEQSVGFDLALDGVVFVSSDGITWEMIDQTAFKGTEEEELDFTPQFINDLASGPQGIVAVGSAGYDGAIWHSADGLNWTQVAHDAVGGYDVQWINRVVIGGPGFVAVGRDKSAAGVWTSADGVTWARVENPAFGGLQEPAEMFDVAASPNGLVAVGSGGFDSDRWGLGFGDLPIVWVSTDGVEWERLPVDTFGDPSTVFFESVEVTEGGFFLESTRYDTLTQWISADGKVWTAASPIPCESEDSGGIRVAEPPGARCHGVGLLELDDAAEFDLFDLDGVTVIGNTVIVTGTVEEGSTIHAAIWLGTLDD